MLKALMRLVSRASNGPLKLNAHDVAAEVLEHLLLEDAGVVEVWYLLAIAQRFLKRPDTLGTLCRARLLYAMTECTQEGILDHVSSLLQEFPQDETDDQMRQVATTLGPRAEEIVGHMVCLSE